MRGIQLIMFNVLGGFLTPTHVDSRMGIWDAMRAHQFQAYFVLEHGEGLHGTLWSVFALLVWIEFSSSPLENISRRLAFLIQHPYVIFRFAFERWSVAFEICSRLRYAGMADIVHGEVLQAWLFTWRCLSVFCLWTTWTRSCGSTFERNVTIFNGRVTHRNLLLEFFWCVVASWSCWSYLLGCSEVKICAWRCFSPPTS